MPNQPSYPSSWSVLTFVALIYNALFVTFRLGFGIPYASWMIFLDGSADLIYIVDLWLAWRTGLFSDGNILAETTTQIRLHRKRWKLFDCIASVPLDLILYAIGAVTAPAVLALMRMTRLLRLVHLFHHFRVWEKRSHHSASVFRLLKLFSLIVVVVHTVACAWFLVGIGEGPNSNSWLVRHELLDQPVAEQYLHSIYWAITTITTVGYGDISPDTNSEILFTIGIMLIGVSLWAYVIGNVASLIANLDSTAQTFNVKVDGIKQYMQYRHLPVELQHRVIHYYDYLWSKNKALNDEQIFEDLPTALRTEILLYLNGEILEKVPFFKGADRGFLHSLVSVLKPQIFCPGDIIINHGEIGSEMYFINKGEVEVIGSDNVSVNHVYKSGDFFGEVALLFSQRRTATVRALTHCDLFVLTKQDLDHILSHYPEFSDRLHQIGSDRYRVAMDSENGEHPLARI